MQPNIEAIEVVIDSIDLAVERVKAAIDCLAIWAHIEDALDAVKQAELAAPGHYEWPVNMLRHLHNSLSSWFDDGDSPLFSVAELREHALAKLGEILEHMEWLEKNYGDDFPRLPAEPGDLP